MLKISFRETPSEEKLPTRDKGSVLNRLAGFLFSAAVAAFAVYIGAQCIASGVYIKHVFGQMTTKSKSSVLNRLTRFFFVVVVAVFAFLFSGTTAKAQNAVVTGNVPSGPASDQDLRLSLRDAINMALRYNLGVIESGENTQIARGQGRVSVGPSENVQQVDLATFGFNRLNVPGIPNVVGPFGYSSVDRSISQTIFSFDSIQRFRAARTAEQAHELLSGIRHGRSFGDSYSGVSVWRDGGAHPLD